MASKRGGGRNFTFPFPRSSGSGIPASEFQNSNKSKKPGEKKTGNPTQNVNRQQRRLEKKKQENANVDDKLDSKKEQDRIRKPERRVPHKERNSTSEKIKKNVETKLRNKGLNKEKVSKLAEVLFDVLQEDRIPSDWNFIETHAETDEADNDSAKYSDDDDDDVSYSELSQISMSRGLSQTFSQSSKVFKRSHEDYQKIGIFWDIENCAIPKGKSVLHFVKKIRDTFCEEYTEERFVVVCNANNQLPTIAKDLSELMVRIEHVSPGKNAADEILRRNIREFAENKDPETKVVLITGDINFNTELHEMRYRKHFNVVLVHNKQTSEALKICANQCISFEEFAADIPIKEASNAPESVMVVVNNLPKSSDAKRIKSRLCQLVYPYGGKVVDVFLPTGEAFVDFTSETAANRAVCALQNEDIFESKIRLFLKKNYKQSLKKKVEEGVLEDFLSCSSNSNGRAIRKQHFNPVNEPVSCPTSVSFCTDKKITLIVLGQILSKEIGEVENLSLVSSIGSQHCYSFVCQSSNSAKKIAQELKIIKGINLYDVQIAKFGVEETKTLQFQKKRISSGTDFEEAKNYCLQQHEVKYEALKKKLDSLMDHSNSSSSDEFKNVYSRLRLLESMKNEFLTSYQHIMEKLANADKFEAQKMFLIECEYFTKAMPVYAYRSQISASISGNQVTIIAGNPGSGKSTQVIQYIYPMLQSGRIVCTEPHKTLVTFVHNKVTTQSMDIAAEAAICDITSFPDSEKKVLFVTDHFLLNECFTNTSLDCYSYVVVDEVQVNSPETEVLLTYLKSVLEKRNDLKLIILGFPGKCKALSKFFKDASLIEVDNKPYPLNKSEVKTTTENYIKDCANLANDLAIISHQNKGNILICLPNVTVINQAEQLLKNFPSITVIKLLFDVNFQENFLKIEKAQKCCVVLATKEIVTTVSINNIISIIDSGLSTIYSCGAFGRQAETVEYNHCTKIMSKQVSKIYVLKLADHVLSKPKTVTSCTESQILYVLGLGMDPFQFQFLKPIAVEDIHSSIKALEKIKAITIGHVITRKGSMMLALALDVHLASLLLDAIDFGIGFVAVCLCIFASTAEHHREKNVNLKAISLHINDLENTLKSINSQYDVQDNSILRIPSDWEIKLQKLLVSSWEDNICILKKPTDLYECRSNQKLIGLLSYSESRPQMIIFETTWKHYSMDYAATYIPIHLEDSNSNLALKPAAKDMVVLHPLGYHIMRSVLIGKNGILKEEWENKLSNIVKYKVKVSHNAFKSKVKIHCNTEDKEQILVEVQKAIKVAQKNLSKQLWEFTICQDTGLKIVWQKRAEVLQLLMPNDCLTVLVVMDLSESTDKIFQHFTTCGPILHHSEKITNKKKHICLMFNNPTSAKKALTFKNKKFSVRYMGKKIVPDTLPNFTALKVTWTRRLNIGSAVVNLDKILPKEVVVSRIVNAGLNTCYSSAIISLELDDKRFLFRQLNITVSKTELEDEIKRKMDGLDVKVSVNLTQEKVFSSNDESIRKMENKLMELVSPVLGRNISIAIRKPEDRDELWMAKISTSDNTIKPKTIESLKNLKLDDCRLFVSETKYCSMFYSNELFSMHKNTFIAEVKRQIASKDTEKSRSHFLVTSGTASNDRSVITFEAGQVADIVMTYQTLCEKFNGTKIDLSKYNIPEHYSLDSSGLSEKLAEVSKKRKAYIKYKKLAEEIVVVGGPEAVNDVDMFLRLQTTIITNPVFTYSCAKPKGMLHTMFDVYGPDLKELQRNIGAIHMRLDINSKALMVWGKKEEAKAVLDFIKSTDNEVPVKENKNFVQCPVCLGNPLKHEKNYRLEYCGHAYCPLCIGGLIAHSALPIICIAPGLQCSNCVSRFEMFAEFYPALITDLATRATLEYIKRNRKHLCFCPVADCDGVLLRRSEIDQCFKCFNALCIKCDAIYHYGQSCTEFKKTKQAKAMPNIKFGEQSQKTNQPPNKKPEVEQSIHPTSKNKLPVSLKRNEKPLLEFVDVMDAPLPPIPYVGIIPTVVGVMDTPLQPYPYVGITPIAPIAVNDPSTPDIRDLQFKTHEIPNSDICDDILSSGVLFKSGEQPTDSKSYLSNFGNEKLEFLSVSAIDSSKLSNDNTIKPTDEMEKAQTNTYPLPDCSSSKVMSSFSQSVVTTPITAVHAGNLNIKQPYKLRKSLVSANIFSGTCSEIVKPIDSSGISFGSLKSDISGASTAISVIESNIITPEPVKSEPLNSVSSSVVSGIQPQTSSAVMGIRPQTSSAAMCIQPQSNSGLLESHFSVPSTVRPSVSGIQSQVASSGFSSESMQSHIAVSRTVVSSVSDIPPQNAFSVSVKSSVINFSNSTSTVPEVKSFFTHPLTSDDARKSPVVTFNKIKNEEIEFPVGLGGDTGKSDVGAPKKDIEGTFNLFDSGLVLPSAFESSSAALPKRNHVSPPPSGNNFVDYTRYPSQLKSHGDITSLQGSRIGSRSIPRQSSGSSVYRADPRNPNIGVNSAQTPLRRSKREHDNSCLVM
uniref:Meiosis regulator and mRNA stability factor 1 n=1 Tax=Strigamia maritima TaxID=126957 RepID=T1J9E0_STRMM